MSVTAVVFVSLLALSTGSTGGIAAYAWRRRDEPGARPFAGLMALTAFWSVCAAATMLARDPVVHFLVEQIQWGAIGFVPVFWVLFALTYTGHDELISVRMVGVLSIIPVISLFLGLTNPLHGLVWVDSHIYITSGIAIAARHYGELYWVFVVYDYALIGTGTLLLLRLVFVSDYLFMDQAVLLALGTIVPLVANAISVAGLIPMSGVDLTPYAFAVSGIAFGYALFRRRLFELVPATRRLGRDTAIATLDDGILILDNNYQVVYLNPKAADVLNCDPKETLGTPAANLIDTDTIDFDIPDALAEFHIEGRFYEARTSTITDRRDHGIGHTLVLHDSTARKHREHRLRRQRDELERLDQLNELIRDITRSFVSATTRDAVEDAVCDGLTASDLYAEATIAIDPDDETVFGDSETEILTPRVIPVTDEERINFADEMLPNVLDTEKGSSVFVPLGYDQMIYGVLTLSTTRANGFSSRERAVLSQFGETISQSLNAVENRRLLLTDTVTELEFHCPDTAIADVSRTVACRLVLKGCVPTIGEEVLAYYRIEDSATQSVVDAATETAGIESAQAIGTESGIVEFTLIDRSPLLALTDSGTNVRTAKTTETGHQIVVEIVPATDVRTLIDRVRTYCPEATLAAKHDHDRPVETEQETELLPDTFAELTERQSEVLEAAYRAGYFRWPRNRTAEEVADSIGISSPTLHKHLRRAEEQLFTVAFDANDDTTQLRNQE